ncbi:E3 ubiquitin-protein ligase rnf168 [Halichoeres trimaculatus]|uniref:E3 ubiquitin-protein ligase rnf168 n=1 Tax=Halichoeres trimaculatus TaxID=147232 RepID=UPI003D9F4446
MEVAQRGGALSLDDCRCPVCLEILIEPVTLPCIHTFCKECFLQAVDQASLLCPLCRKRISVWCRKNSKNNTLINQQLWTNIQKAFPDLCERRLRGQEVSEDEPAVSVCFPRVSEPGEVRQEYEQEVIKLTEERRVLEEEERKASEELIQRLLAEEEEELLTETKRREEDERLARLLSSQLNSADESQGDNHPAEVTPAKKKKKEVSAGLIERFLSRPSKSSSSDCIFVANKENIRLSEELKLELHPASTSASEEQPLLPASLRGHLTTEGGASCAKRKSRDLGTAEEEDEAVMATKRVCVSSPAVLQGLAEWEEELLSRRQQEEEDRRLALLLQKELDQEERQRATDRRKGSSDAYLLRQDCRSKEEDGRKTRRSASASSAASSPSPSSSSSSSSSTSSCRGSKQKTLKEMFSSLNN